MSKHEEIADSLTHDILVGQYRTGERLPSERDLAVRFDANRGAVREAMKKLEQLGVADIQPGGARVVPVEEASLDVIGHLLAVGEVPDSKLVDQILEAIAALMQTAVVAAVNLASANQLEELRALTRPLYAETLQGDAHRLAQFSLMRALLVASENLAVQLIAKSLLLQFVPRMAPLEGFTQLDLDTHRNFAQQLDAALGRRDPDEVRNIVSAMCELDREAVKQGFEAYEVARIQNIQEVAAS
jgi:DNA-binding FadR family transcriptional regulator